MQNKAIFNRVFDEHVKREWLNTSNCGLQEFTGFIARHPTMVVKPLEGGQGKGVCKYTHDPASSIAEVHASMRGSLIEEVIDQHHRMSQLNPFSVNTVRLVTFLGKNSVKVIAASLRMGVGDNVVDNLHSGGLAAAVDTLTGTVTTAAINNELKRFDRHPTTNEKFIGFTIPYWDQAIEVVLKAAKEIPELRYVGWDLAFSNEGVELLEANHDPGHDVIQMADVVGKYEIIKQATGQPALKSG